MSTSSAGCYVFFPRSRHSYYARITIPVSIRHLFKGRVECWKSLGTKDKALAKFKASQWNARLQRLFYTLSMKGGSMHQAEVDALIQKWMLATLDQCEEVRAEQLSSMTDDEVEDQKMGCSMAAEDAHVALSSGNYRGVKGEVDELLASNQLPALDPTLPAFTKLAREFLRAKLSLYQEEGRRWMGDYPPTATTTAAAPAHAVASAAVAPALAPTKLFSEVGVLYLSEYKTRRPKTQGQIAATFKEFLSVTGGDRPVGDVSKQHCREYKAHLVAKGERVSTTNQKLSRLGFMWKWAKGQGYVSEAAVSPIDGLKINKAIQKKDSLKRLPFTAPQLQLLVDHPDFQREKTRHPERYWMVWLGVYAGMRREEIAQLLVSEVVTDPASGVVYFNVVEEGSHQLKTDSSTRRVPLAAKLIALGFLDYVAQVRAKGQARVFYQSKYTPNGYGDAAGRWFSVFIRKTLKLPKAIVFHSTRHGFITGLHAAGVPDQLVMSLCGHMGETGEVHAGYVHRSAFPLTKLREAVDMLDLGLR